MKRLVFDNYQTCTFPLKQSAPHILTDLVLQDCLLLLGLGRRVCVNKINVLYREVRRRDRLDMGIVETKKDPIEYKETHYCADLIRISNKRHFPEVIKLLKILGFVLSRSIELFTFRLDT